MKTTIKESWEVTPVDLLEAGMKFREDDNNPIHTVSVIEIDGNTVYITTEKDKQLDFPIWHQVEFLQRRIIKTRAFDWFRQLSRKEKAFVSILLLGAILAALNVYRLERQEDDAKAAAKAAYCATAGHSETYCQ